MAKSDSPVGERASRSPAAPLAREFYARDARVVARELLNKVLVHGDRAARIVEVEAYLGGEDPASHAFRGPTPRTRVMFGPPGHLYVYFSYGMHWCANVVCGTDGVAMAVLLRAAAPVRGVEAMRASRPAARRDRDLCSGPGKLCQALGITRDHNGADLVDPGASLFVADDEVRPPASPGRSPRVGISSAQEREWRWFVPDDPNLSRGR